MSDRRGLRDVVAVESRLSAIIDDDLTFRGIPIGDLFAHSNFEEVTFLLWFGGLPTAAALAAFRERLAAATPLPAATLDLLPAIAATDPTRALETGVLALAGPPPRALSLPLAPPGREGSLHWRGESPTDPVSQAVRLLVGLPLVVAGFDRRRRGLPPAPLQPRGSLARQFLSAWRDREPAPGEANALDLGFVLTADHELNAATFAARVAASTGADICSAVLAAVATQSGPLHGGALQSTGELLSAGTPEQATVGVLSRLDAGERIPGFGHPVYRRGDPRVPLFRLLAEDLAAQTGDRRHLDAADRIAAIMADRKGLPANMDLYAAACWLSLGIPADLFPAIFAFGRLAGWIAHIREQYADNRLIRPRAHYAGPTIQRYVPIEERQ